MNHTVKGFKVIDQGKETFESAMESFYERLCKHIPEYSSEYLHDYLQECSCECSQECLCDYSIGTCTHACIKTLYIFMSDQG